MTNFSSPVPVGARYTSGFGRRWGTLHAGDDYAPRKRGDADPIYAAADGTVENTGTGILSGHSGKIVILDHGMLTGNGSTDHTKTNYGHCSKIVVKRGQKVKAGQLIAYMGATGNATGVHAHCGVRFKKKGTTRWKFSSFHKWMASKGITPGKTAPRKPDDGLIFKHGSEGAKVKAWQLSMNKAFPAYSKFNGDGKYESYSETVTREFQSRVGLRATGVVDEATAAAMRKHGVTV